MSVKMMTAVFERYPNGGGEMILALALADHAHDDGRHIFPGIDTLMEKTRQARRTVQYQLRRMEESGWLILVNSGNGGRNQRSEYRINPDWIDGAELPILEKNCANTAPFKNDEKGAIDDTKGANDDIKGCNLRQERVQRVAPAYNHHRTINESSKNHTGARASRAVDVEIPNWLPDDVWHDWVEHRKAVKAPLTQRAAELCLKKLDRLRSAGNCPIAVIEQSIITGKWTDLYRIRSETVTAGSGKPGKFNPTDYFERRRRERAGEGDGDAIDV